MPRRSSRTPSTRSRKRTRSASSGTRRRRNSKPSRRRRASSSSSSPYGASPNPKLKIVRPPPKVDPWRKRKNATQEQKRRVREYLKEFPVQIASKMDRAPAGTPGLVRGGSKRAREIYPLLYWEENDYKVPFNYDDFPLDIVIVERRAGAPSFFVNDGKYPKTASSYTLLSNSCVVCTAGYSIMCVFVTSGAVPSLNPLKTHARDALKVAKRDLVARHGFAIGGNYTTDPDMAQKRKNVMTERMNGTIWNDGLQTYTSATPGWGGFYFTQYFKRDPESDVADFALPYAGMYATEQLVVPGIAKKRLALVKKAKLPSAFKGLPQSVMPATQVGISEDFSVKTHADSCILGVTESIYWANRNLKNIRFAVTSCEIAFDIGKRPCLLFMKGNEMHGTVPGGTGSSGLVLITKRNTVQQFKPKTYTDLTA